MLSIAIKNTILLFLIVLILHFMIKKYLFDHKYLNVPTAVPPAAVVVTTANPPPVESFDVSPPTLTAAPPEINGELEDQLLKYVMANSPQSAAKVMDATTCGVPSSQDFPIETSLKKGKKEERGCSSFMVVNEYDAENGLNGGTIFGNLAGYNSCDDMFSTIDSVSPGSSTCQEFTSFS